MEWSNSATRITKEIKTVLTKNDVTTLSKNDVTTLLQIAYNQGIADGITIGEQTNKKERLNIRKNAEKNDYKFKTFMFYP
jgi:hypothetical protein